MTQADQAAPRTAFIHHRVGIGDLIWHLPYIRASAQQSAGGKIVVVAPPSSRASELLAAEPTVSRVIEFGLRGANGWRERIAVQLALCSALREERIERAIIFSGRVRYALLACIARIPRRAGFGFSPMQRLLLNEPPFIRPFHGDGNWVYPEATAFAVAQGLVPGPVVPRMHVPGDIVERQDASMRHLPRPRLALVIGAADRRRNWGAQRFAALATAMLQRDHAIVLIGGPDEAQLAKEIVSAIPAAARDRVMTVAQASILVSAATLRHCDACVGNDTGALNMAAANAVPSIGLFGVSPPLRHDPILRAVTGAGMDAIAVDAVIAALAGSGFPLEPAHGNPGSA